MPRREAQGSEAGAPASPEACRVVRLGSREPPVLRQDLDLQGFLQATGSSSWSPARRLARLAEQLAEQLAGMLRRVVVAGAEERLAALDALPDGT